MRFYLGTHDPSWLATVDVPLMVSRVRLERRRHLPVARVPWVLDSGGFTELSIHGRWSITAAEYAAMIERYRAEIGRLEWAAPMDWMCEPFVLAKTGYSIDRHQALTVESVAVLRSLGAPVIPVLQGYTISEYLACAARYAAAGIDLTAEPIVGLGSVCRRERTHIIGPIVGALRDTGLALHGFGCKEGALRRYGALLASADSMAWSYGGRRRGTCTHLASRCANHLHWALDWRARVVGAQRGDTWQAELALSPNDGSRATPVTADYGAPCVSGPPINVDLDRCVAQCPRCDYTFSIIAPDAVCPAHWVDGSGA